MFCNITAFIGLGGGELLLVMLVFILLFGAKDAPRFLRAVQAVFEKIQRASADVHFKIMHSDLNLPVIDPTPDNGKTIGLNEDEPDHPETSPTGEPHEKSDS
ncbi:MAG: hypothetical protein MUC65_09025 [Pontiellaceae bacterium]|jgi:Sec-independent protein translocase protein TatA|nr:hypothetical protein [Pontiellaceae bacterium]